MNAWHCFVARALKIFTALYLCNGVQQVVDLWIGCPSQMTSQRSGTLMLFKNKTRYIHIDAKIYYFSAGHG